MLQNSAGAVRLSRFDREQGGGSAISRRAPALTSFALEVEEVPTGTCPECDAEVHVDTDADGISWLRITAQAAQPAG